MFNTTECSIVNIINSNNINYKMCSKKNNNSLGLQIDINYIQIA